MFECSRHEIANVFRMVNETESNVTHLPKLLCCNVNCANCNPIHNVFSAFNPQYRELGTVAFSSVETIKSKYFFSLAITPQVIIKNSTYI